jgi:peptidoglycan hydrolase-like protein with peptidoglycan-binding domain
MVTGRRQVLGMLAAGAVWPAGVALATPGLAEVQRALASLGLDPGPADGAWGPRTAAAVAAFAAHRGLAFDGTLTDEIATDAVGYVLPLPQAVGLELRAVGGRFPSADSLTLDDPEPGAFTLRLRAGDYDTVDYRGKTDPFNSARALGMAKQRAEIAGQTLRVGRPWTVDFDVWASGPEVGTFFQVHRGDNSAHVLAYPGAMRFSAGEMWQNVALLRADWYGVWQPMRVMFRPETDDSSVYRIWVSGELVLDTEGQPVDFPFDNDEGATLHFGMYRGQSGTPAEVRFRNIALNDGDLGPPAAG